MNTYFRVDRSGKLDPNSWHKGRLATASSCENVSASNFRAECCILLMAVLKLEDYVYITSCVSYY